MIWFYDAIIFLCNQWKLIQVVKVKHFFRQARDDLAAMFDNRAGISPTRAGMQQRRPAL